MGLGPGLGKGIEISEFVREFVIRCPVPLVIDADALNVLAEESDHGRSILSERIAPTILTPHPGEMGRLLGIKTETVQDDRKEIVTRASENFGCVVLLKGSETLIADPDGMVYLNTTGNPGMATGGTGDVLTGVIAAVLAQHLEPRFATAAGVYLHGLAGDLFVNENGGATGLIATDIISRLPKAIALCQKSKVASHFKEQSQPNHSRSLL